MEGLSLPLIHTREEFQNQRQQGEDRRVKIRIGDHLMPENPGVPFLLTLPSVCIRWGVRMGLSNLLPHGARSYPQTQGPLYLYLFNILRKDLQ